MSTARMVPRLLGWAGRVFLGLAALALAGFIVGLIISGTVFSVPKGCEECEPHISVVLVSLALLPASVLCGIVGIVLYLASQRATPVRNRQRSRPR